MSGGKGSELTFWEHLAELVRRLRIILYSVIACTLVAMLFPVSLDRTGFSPSNPWYTTIASLVINKMRENFLPPGVELIPVSFFASLQVYILVSLILGVLLSSPITAYEVYKFVNPALYRRERRAVLPFILSFTALFASGFAIGYVLVVPMTLRLLILMAEPFGLAKLYSFTEFFSLVAGSLLVCGIMFTTPIYFVLLVKAGILTTDHLRKNRKYVYPALIIIIALLDPDPSLVTETFLGVPLIILLEISILVARRYERPRKEPKSR